MTWFILISLLILGAVLVLVEILFIPGTTVVGILGLLMTAAGLYYGFQIFSYSTAIAIVTITVLVNLLLIVYGFRSGVWDKFSLKETISSRSFDDRLQGLEVGQKGKAVSDLRPYGKAIFGDVIYEVKSESGLVTSGTEIYIEKLENNRIIIKQ